MFKSLAILSVCALAAAALVPQSAEAQARVRYVAPKTPPKSISSAIRPQPAPTARIAPGAAVRSNPQLIQSNRGGRLIANDGAGIVAGGAGNFRRR